jgi:hypothetical protein
MWRIGQYPSRKRADVRLVLRCEKYGGIHTNLVSGRTRAIVYVAKTRYGCMGHREVPQSGVGRFSTSRVTRGAFGVLEPYDGKLSRTVLREACELVTVLWAGNRPSLPALSQRDNRYNHQRKMNHFQRRHLPQQELP